MLCQCCRRGSSSGPTTRSAVPLVYAGPASTEYFITFIQRRPNVFDVGPHCINVIQMFCVCWGINPHKCLCFSGRAPAALTLDRVTAEGWSTDNPWPRDHGHCITVPGAPAAFHDVITSFGSVRSPIHYHV